jgi:2'-5' RNA ligase
MRLFLAIEPDAAVTAAVASVQHTLQQVLADAASAIRWTPPGNAHVTLHFLGEVPPHALDALRAVLGETLPGRAFTATLGAAGAFPPSGRASTLWIRVGRGASEMQRVQADLAERLRLGHMAVDPRPFSPHITIGRVRQHHRQKLPALRARLDEVQVPDATWTVTRVTLFSSDLSGPVPRYVSLQHIRLAGG